MKIYIVTAGEYSDYHIEAVFTDKKQAELFCAIHEYDLEEYEADEIQIDTNKKPKKIWHFCKHRKNESLTIWTKGMTLDEMEDFSQYVKTISLDADIDEEKAKKIICDKYYKWKYEKM